MFDIPGFLNASLLNLRESNAPYNTYSGVSTPRYSYKNHLMLTFAWSIPVGMPELKFEGYADFIAAKGQDEFGNKTAPETNIDVQLMYDVGSLFGAKGLRAGLGFQYWKNKFGNDNSNSFFKGGALAKTTMLKVDYHF